MTILFRTRFVILAASQKNNFKNLENILQKIPSQKLKPRLIALDMDDTLLTSGLQISDRAVNAIQKLAAQKIFIVICTGRMQKGIEPFVRRLCLPQNEFSRYAILSNGSLIFDLHSKREIFSRKVDYEILLRAKEEAARLGLPCQVYDSENSFSNVENNFSRKEVILSKIELKVPDDFDSFLKQGFSKMLIPGDEQTIKKLFGILQNALGERAVIVISKPYFLEVLPPNSGKGEALEILSERLGIKMRDVMAFGDSMNDETMILKSGLSVAMKNGLQTIQDEAKFVTRFSNDEDGVADFLEEFVL